ncbi:lipocalin-like domain-containing protein [Methylobacterium tarhaniae]|uniref:lipocalin-like domain-containing protein n=1 Tax=Methylobacterium tarhaniae TaxID=1187852 RepID=UPI003D0272ED
MRRCFVSLLCLAAVPAHALDARDLHGTWKLVSSSTKEIESGQERDTLGSSPNGYITYDADGRMMTVATSRDRPNVGDTSKLTEEVRAKLQRSMWAYAGTYTVQGNSVMHKIETSWNEIWNGMTMVRDVQKREDGRLIFTTKPQKGNQTGKMEVLTIVWEKLK